jgi:hypothetical protein
MAMLTVTVALAATDTATFTFTKPAGKYGKTAPGITNDGTPVGHCYLGDDVDNGNGTMTGTLKLSGAITGTAEITIYDRP